MASRAHHRLNRIAAQMALVTFSAPPLTSIVSREIRCPGRSAPLRRLSVAASALEEAIKPVLGSDVTSLETPQLLIIADRLEKNLKSVFTHLPDTIAVRPHAKTHKSPVIGQMQIDAGACGLCAAKLSEAEALVKGGCLDVCITNQVVGRGSIARLARLAAIPGARVSVCVDSKDNIAEIAAAMREHKVSGFEVLVEINVGQNRCGVEPGAPAVEIAKAIEAEGPTLKFQGIHAYHGANQHVRQPEERKGTVDGKVASGVKLTLEGLEKAGIKCPVVTGGGTGSYLFEAGTGLYNEVQPGSYIFMDVDYSKNLQSDQKPGPGVFSPSLFILSTVVSVSEQGWAVVDAGMKAVSLDSGAPRIVTLDTLKHVPNVEYICGGDEHGILKKTDGSPLRYSVGDMVLLQPGHCDPTVNLHDYFTVVSKRQAGGSGSWFVKEIIDVAARGPGH